MTDETIKAQSDTEAKPDRPAEKPKKELADTLRELGFQVSEKDGGGCVITGVEPPNARG